MATLCVYHFYLIIGGLNFLMLDREEDGECDGAVIDKVLLVTSQKMLKK